MGGKKKRSHQSHSPAAGKKHKQSGTQSKGKDVAADGATGHGRKLDSSLYIYWLMDGQMVMGNGWMATAEENEQNNFSFLSVLFIHSFL